MSEPTLLDQFEIAQVHELFAERFPRVERQPPLVGIQPFIMPDGYVQIELPTISFSPVQELARWWFSNASGRNLIQLQEDFLGRNWRRTDPTPAPLQEYPAFEGIFEDFKSARDQLRHYHNSHVRNMPDPAVFDLIYTNNVRQIRADGSKRRLSDVISILEFKEEIPKAMFSISWLEKIEEGFTSNSLILKVQFNAVAIANLLDPNQPPDPSVRISLNARARCSTWNEFDELAPVAHEAMRRRLLSLTRPEVHASWDENGDR